MNTLDALQLVVVAVVAIWGVYQVRVTSRLQQEVHRLNSQLDQSIQLLYRTREAIIAKHKAALFLIEYKQGNPNLTNTSEYLMKHAEAMAAWAELRGLAFAIGDKQLLEVVNKDFYIDGNITEQEMNMRLNSQLIHTRISELLLETIKKHNE